MLRNAPLEVEFDADPSSLSEPAIQIDTGESEYSHAKQRRIYKDKENNDTTMGPFPTIGWTQTTTGTGMPVDKDND
jgi:hypothetical protein